MHCIVWMKIDISTHTSLSWENKTKPFSDQCWITNGTLKPTNAMEMSKQVK